ncbi:hypothetical protein ACFT2C_08750 [Promicromonospora sp. NPDC057138]|uniref:hypothetical protein n=1 Tax=Promicromonospora sp. NPDC057138 TaxID=3346031 RepID=UPI003635EB9C
MILTPRWLRGENHRKQPFEVLDGGLYWQGPQLHLKDPNTVALWHELNHLVDILRTLEAMVRRAAHVLGCRALDCSTSEFIENRGHHGWDEFQAYRDMVYQRARCRG